MFVIDFILKFIENAMCVGNIVPASFTFDGPVFKNAVIDDDQPCYEYIEIHKVFEEDPHISM